HSYFHEEVLLSCRRADTEHPYRPSRSVVKLVGSVGRNVECLAGVHDRFLAAKSCFHIAFEQDESFLEVVPMRRRPSAWRDMHIDHAEASIRLLARDCDGVGIADQTDVRQVVGLRQCKIASEIVRWDGW